ncbi:hypothetical protein DMH17_08310 [Raoultella planticola]|nr:hypothetical protein [Raoultella planticola]
MWLIRHRFRHLPGYRFRDNRLSDHFFDQRLRGSEVFCRQLFSDSLFRHGLRHNLFNGGLFDPRTGGWRLVNSSVRLGLFGFSRFRPQASPALSAVIRSQQPVPSLNDLGRKLPRPLSTAALTVPLLVPPLSQQATL